MASSSVSQESLDKEEDFELNARRSRIRTLRARGALHRSGERDGGDNVCLDKNGREQNGEHGGDEVSPRGHDHDSPTHITPSRVKDKRTRPNHLHKGKLPKDKRKLREKRRSTGVVHLASTESTGDSLDDDNNDDKILFEAKKNASINEVIDADNPQTPADEHSPRSFAARRNNKSPSDLEADLEDNQDYDSAVSQSETNLSLLGRSDSTETPPNKCYQSDKPLPFSRFSPIEPYRPYKPGYSTTNSDYDSKYNTSSTSSSSSVLSRYRDTEPQRDPHLPSQEVPNIKPVSTYLSRYQDRRTGETESPSYNHRNRYRDNREQGFGNHRFTPALKSPRDEEKANLEKLLEKEREENRTLRSTIEDKDKRITELEREVSLLNKEMDDMDIETQNLLIEKNALIQAVSHLSTQV